MLLAEFDFEGNKLEFHTAPNGEPVITASSLVRALKGNANNAASIARNNVRAKWIIEIPLPGGGKPQLCLFEPGAYQLATNPMFQTEVAIRFQDLLFEVILPKLRAGALSLQTALAKPLTLSQRLTLQKKLRAETRAVLSLPESDPLYALSLPLIQECWDAIGVDFLATRSLSLLPEPPTPLQQFQQWLKQYQTPAGSYDPTGLIDAGWDVETGKDGKERAFISFQTFSANYPHPITKKELISFAKEVNLSFTDNNWLKVTL